jgi:hypothetical protein
MLAVRAVLSVAAVDAGAVAVDLARRADAVAAAVGLATGAGVAARPTIGVVICVSVHVPLQSVCPAGHSQVQVVALSVLPPVQSTHCAWPPDGVQSVPPSQVQTPLRQVACEFGQQTATPPASAQNV